jgi:hypothetical protein
MTGKNARLPKLDVTGSEPLVHARLSQIPIAGLVA